MAVQAEPTLADHPFVAYPGRESLEDRCYADGCSLPRSAHPVKEGQ